MGKHGKQVDCSACKGSGTEKICRNGKTDTVPCQVCKGAGKV